jgi:nitroreductase
VEGDSDFMTTIPTDLHPLLLRRRSLRAIDPTLPVEPAMITRLLDAARWAPSSGNTQPWRFVVVTEPDALARAREALKPGNRTWADRAPLLIVVCANPDDDGYINGQPIYLFDCGSATENLLLQGIVEGLVVHPMGGWDEGPMRAALEIPDPYRVMVVVAIGHPGKLEDLPEGLQQRETAERVRKPLTELVHYNRWTAPREGSGQ